MRNEVFVPECLPAKPDRLRRMAKEWQVVNLLVGLVPYPYILEEDRENARQKLIDKWLDARSFAPVLASTVVAHANIAIDYGRRPAIGVGPNRNDAFYFLGSYYPGHNLHFLGHNGENSYNCSLYLNDDASLRLMPGRPRYERSLATGLMGGFDRCLLDLANIVEVGPDSFAGNSQS